MSKFALGLLISAALIFLLGVLMVFNTTAAEVLHRGLDRSTSYAVVKQLVYALFAIFCALGIYLLGYHNVLKLSGIFLGIITLLLILVLVPGVGKQINGARRWFVLFGNSLQPSEFARLFIPLYFIKGFVQEKKALTLRSFLTAILILSFPMGLILIEPDNGTVAIILVTLCTLFILTKVKWTYWALPLGIVALCGVAVASQMSHVSDRIQIYLHPESDLRGKGHQPYQAKIATGTGGVFGRGIGESLQKLDYLPEARSDYIAAIFAEECGFVGVVGLLMLYMTLGGLGFYIASQAPDREGMVVASILTFLICFQVFLNLGVVSGLLPSKGTNLPFFSHGGSSLMANFMALGMILSVSKYVREPKEA